MAFNLGGGIGGALSGATSGGALGSIIPGLGSAIGAGVGGLVGGIGGLFGKKNKMKKPKKMSTFDPKQQALYKQFISGLSGKGQFSNLYDFDSAGYNDVFDQTVSRPANRNFQENIIPQITGQFRTGNIMNSSYTGNALAREGRNVQENLDALRSQNVFQGQQQAQQNKLGGLQQALGMTTFDYSQPSPRTPSVIDQILGTTGPAAGQWFADFLNKKNTASPSVPTIPTGSISNR